ncbi:MAG TPA: SpvB/TcaC N-terminal domain-containing protein [Vicinamibacterales bacterium]|nr:SpvB/TcaC N-terminal domain-containing protein [Vicinamibacterales bacterium]
MNTPSVTGQAKPSKDPRFSAPAVALPKGGGAIKSIGEKFSANAASGTGALSIALPLSEGRGGFTPGLALSYDSGAGNGPYGIGWSIGAPAITRRTDRGLPKYLDAAASDVFLLSGAEDLVAVLDADGSPRSELRNGYGVVRYRPRVEGLFARIERWTHVANPSDSFWRSISRDNVTSFYGKTAESRIADPQDPTRIFAWLVCEGRDDKGNAAVYEYAAEDSRGVDTRAAHESQRSSASRSANRHLKRVKYGNTVSCLQEDFGETEWLFELVMDYGDHEGDVPTIHPTREWLVRPDPFSTERPGFEVRTYRRCHRMLMFHRFRELGDAPRLVRALTIDYDDLDYDVATAPDARTEIGHPGSTRLRSLLRRATITGYSDAGIAKSLPPLELTYSRSQISEVVRTLDDESARHLPAGVDGRQYQWVDFNSEGLSGVLTQQGGAWWFKPNLGGGRLGVQECIAEIPAAEAAAGLQFVDLAGDGQLDAVQLTAPIPGFFERTADDRWAPFTPFISRVNVAWDNPNLRLVDLTGDGHADILMTEDDVFSWHASLGEDGYAPGESIRIATDEIRGPKLVFNDATGTVFLADMSGDGLSDLVRVRNGEVCYWPNVGYGRFGAKVIMDDAPVFDVRDRFDPSRIRFADIDGSGVADIIYLAADGVTVYFNRAGNGWARPCRLASFPPIDNQVDVSVVDLLGNGTACLVWSSALPRDAGSSLRFVDLMGGIKPHLLTTVDNNLGAETTVHYASSTQFYLADRLAGRPWITRLAFPVHVVARIESHDHISRNRFVTRYAYHHGYFDGVEREFRGFGMVEQWDTEERDVLRADAALNEELASQVPPVLTRTWFHTGVHFGGNRIADFFAGLLDADDAGEYYREPGRTDDDVRKLLLTDAVLPPGLLAAEEREACRALKGALLRKEVYALDGTAREPHPYVVTEQSFEVRLVQRRGANPHAVFFSHPREQLTFHYERAPDDPRIAHTAFLDVDAFGNPLRSISVGYGRRRPDTRLAPDDQAQQARLRSTLTETAVTNAIDAPNDHRTPSPAETRIFELTGLDVSDARSVLSFDELRRAFDDAETIGYEETPVEGSLQKRILKHMRTLYRRDDLSGALAPGQQDSRGLPFESYTLAFTIGLLNDVYGPRIDDDLLNRQAGYVHIPGSADWWTPSGHVFYSPGSSDNASTELAYAEAHFFLPRRYRDPFHTPQVSTEQLISFDPYDLLIVETRDAAGNVVTVGERDDSGAMVFAANDYRTLQPRMLMDANRNRSAVAFDALGFVVGTAVMGKPVPAAAEGDSLAGFEADLPDAVAAAHLTSPLNNPHAVLAQATTRVIYDALAYWRTKHDPLPQPTVAYAMARETHANDSGGPLAAVQHVFAYADGYGREIQRKVQAEPGPVPTRDPDGHVIVGGDGSPAMTTNDVEPRWISTGWVVFDNKGNPVREFEPFFTDRHQFEFDVRLGVSPVRFYDPLGRVVGILRPDRAWEKRVFDAWRQETWDVNDTSLIAEPITDLQLGDFFARLPHAAVHPTWFAARANGALGAEERTSARKTAVHAATPAVAHADALGRMFLSVTHNRFRFGIQPDSDLPAEARFETRVRYDIDGNRREVIDAAQRTVIRCDYNLLGDSIHHTNMDAGETWRLVDVSGHPICAWESSGHRFRMTYDALRRPLDALVLPDGATAELVAQRTEYGDRQPGGEAANLRGKAVALFDQSGVVSNGRYDFKGNLLEAERRITQEFQNAVDWLASPVLEPDIFRTTASYDALNRPLTVTSPDESIYLATFNRSNLLERVDLTLAGEIDVTTVVQDIDYDARSQRARITYGNGTETRYSRDRLTQRLSRLTTTRLIGGNVLQDLRYNYDPAGNVTEIRDDAQQTIFFDNQVVPPNALFTYDALYRLIDAEGREHIGQASQPESTWDDRFRRHLPHPTDGQALRRYRQQYDYDPLGNILQLIHEAAGGSWTRHYSYSEPSALEPQRTNNRLSSTSIGSVNPVVESYTYDGHGNTASLTHLPVIGWDFWNQLRATSRQVTTSATPETTFYVYDWSGRRVRKVTTSANGARKSEHTYLGGFERYREYDGSGNVTLQRNTLHVMEARQRVALIEMRTVGDDGSPLKLVRYQLGNHLGSCSLEIDQTGAIISYEEYMPYGSTSLQAARSQIHGPKRFRYAAMERDEESGFSYHGARYYAPWLARWLNPDPNGIKADTNLYLFCHVNPMVFVDLDGRDPVHVGEPGDLSATATLDEITAYAKSKGYTYSDPHNQRRYEPTPDGGRWVGGTLKKKVYDPAVENDTGFGNESSNKDYAKDSGTIKSGDYQTKGDSGGDYDPFAPKKPKTEKTGGGGKAGRKGKPGGSPDGKSETGSTAPGATVTGTGKEEGTAGATGSEPGPGTGDGSGAGQDGWLPEVIGTILTVVVIVLAVFTIVSVITAFTTYFSFSMLGLKAATYAAAAEATPFIAGMVGATVTSRQLTPRQVDRAIVTLRNGGNVRVQSLNQMRQIQDELGQLGVRPESSSTIIPQRPPVDPRGRPDLPGSHLDGRGTFRVDPPHGPGNSPGHPAHEDSIHINITLRDGTKVDIAVDGTLKLQ